MRDCLKQGWLSPAGELYPCSSFDHIDEARKIVKNYGYNDTDNFKSVPADDVLLSKGWVYIGISSFRCHEWRIGWKCFLTESQKTFLKPYFEMSDIPVNTLAKTRYLEKYVRLDDVINILNNPLKINVKSYRGIITLSEMSRAFAEDYKDKMNRINSLDVKEIIE